ncbi:hypothetical protein TWF696_005312 [Orbilia brochopaga]|uniref:Uncharacterized protein n=1 Tax=Orbilia brochopaga TaxID=3140254 RepID=A0AAV9V1P8_9PEZI
MPKKRRRTVDVSAADFQAPGLPDSHCRLIEHVLAGGARLNKVQVAQLPHGVGIVAAERIKETTIQAILRKGKPGRLHKACRSAACLSSARSLTWPTAHLLFVGLFSSRSLVLFLQLVVRMPEFSKILLTCGVNEVTPFLSIFGGLASSRLLSVDLSIYL